MSAFPYVDIALPLDHITQSRMIRLQQVLVFLLFVDFTQATAKQPAAVELKGVIPIEGYQKATLSTALCPCRIQINGRAWHNSTVLVQGKVDESLRATSKGP